MITLQRATTLQGKPIELVSQRVDRNRSADYAFEQVGNKLWPRSDSKQLQRRFSHLYDDRFEASAFTQERLVEHLNRIEKQHLENSEEADRKQTFAEFEKILEKWNDERPAAAAAANKTQELMGR